MINQRTQNIIDIVDQFSGKNGEPGNDTERYLLKSMWVMMLSEFEGSTKDLVEFYINNMKNSEIENIHICLLLQNFYPNKEEGLTIDNILSIHKKNPKDITYKNFTRDFKPKYKTQAVEKLFNTLGIFFSEEEKISLKELDSIASTRDSIAHGDMGIQITTKELKNRLSDIENIFVMLRNKLSSSLNERS